MISWHFRYMTFSQIFILTDVAIFNQLFNIFPYYNPGSCLLTDVLVNNRIQWVLNLADNNIRAAKNNCHSDTNIRFKFNIHCLLLKILDSQHPS